MGEYIQRRADRDFVLPARLGAEPLTLEERRLIAEAERAGRVTMCPTRQAAGLTSLETWLFVPSVHGTGVQAKAAVVSNLKASREKRVRDARALREARA